MLAAGGDPTPPIWSRVLWAVLEGLLAAALLLSGGLTSLQAGSLMTALPFSVILLLMCVALVKALSLDRAVLREHDRIRRLQMRSEEHTSELQSRGHLVCRLLLEKKKMRGTHSIWNRAV